MDAANEKALRELVVSIAKDNGIEVHYDDKGEVLFKKEDEAKLTRLVVTYISRYSEAKG